MPSAHALTNHDEIRRWAEARGAQPACVKGTGRKGDTGMIRLDFPGFSGGDSLQGISWDRWFKSFDDNKLALLVQDKLARGGRSNFNKLVARRTAEGKQHSRRSAQGNGRARKTETGRRSSGSRTSSARKASSSTRKASSSRKASSNRNGSSSGRQAAERPARRKTSTRASSRSRTTTKRGSQRSRSR